MHLQPVHGRIVLADPTTFDRFHVVRPSDVEPAALAAVLAEQGAGQLDGDHVRVSTAWLRSQAPDEDWLEGLSAMVDYAAGKGWTDEDRTWVRAHLVTE